LRRRFLSLFILLFFALPVGISLSGCAKGTSSVFCSGTIGPRVGDPQTITLTPTVGGLSMGFGQTQNVTTPTAADCKNNTVSISKYTYSTVDPNNAAAIPVADVNPTTGQLCAGTWNRNTPGGVADYTFCTSTGKSGTAALTASGGGANSNKVLVYVHPQITAITLGTASTDCTNDPATNCPQYTASSLTTAEPYVPNTCISFGTARQLVARFYAGTDNITYSAGHATFTAPAAWLQPFPPAQPL
jgi:trimeric autotransporter adhesin